MQLNEHPVEQEEVMAYLDGELPSGRAAIVEAHLQECGDCQGLAAELRDVSRQLTNWGVEIRAAWLPGKIASALRGGRSARKWGWWAGSAICLAMAFLLLFFLSAPKLESPTQLKQLWRARGRMEQIPLAPNYGIDSAPPAEQDAVADKKALATALMAPPRPMLARTSQLVLITKDFDRSRGALEDILKRHRGYLGQLDITTVVGGPRTLNATLRLPTDQLDLAMGEIKRLGQIESESQSGEDVTRQYVDLDTRLTNSRNTEQRLNALRRERTAQMADVLAVEKETDRVRGDIEQMEQEKKALANRVDFATLSVTMREASRAGLTPNVSARLRRAAADGYDGLVDGAISVAVFLLAAGPSLLLWGGLILLGLRFTFNRIRAASQL